jgi:hypothetical protein
MDGKPGPSERPVGEGAPAAAEAAPSTGGEPREPGPQERFGPLTLTRTRKDDGRALLVFSRAQSAAR